MKNDPVVCSMTPLLVHISLKYPTSATIGINKCKEIFGSNTDVFPSISFYFNSNRWESTCIMVIWCIYVHTIDTIWVTTRIFFTRPMSQIYIQANRLWSHTWQKRRSRRLNTLGGLEITIRRQIINTGAELSGLPQNSTFKLNLPWSSRSITPKITGILTKVFWTSDTNLVILAWTADELSCGQARDWYTHAHTHTHGRTHRLTYRRRRWQYPEAKIA